MLRTAFIVFSNSEEAVFRDKKKISCFLRGVARILNFSLARQLIPNEKKHFLKILR